MFSVNFDTLDRAEIYLNNNENIPNVRVYISNDIARKEIYLDFAVAKNVSFRSTLRRSKKRGGKCLACLADGNNAGRSTGRNGKAREFFHCAMTRRCVKRHAKITALRHSFHSRVLREPAI